MRRSGFTTIIALTLLALITAALAAMAVAVHAEGQRTQSLQVHAELRQLLMAGGTAMKQRVKDWPAVLSPSDTSIELPTDLSTAKVIAHLISDGPSTATLRLEARWQNQQMFEVIRLQKGATGWKIEDAYIVPSEIRP